MVQFQPLSINLLLILEQFRSFFFSYRGHSTSWHIRAREEVKGQIEVKREREERGAGEGCVEEERDW